MYICVPASWHISVHKVKRFLKEHAQTREKFLFWGGGPSTTSSKKLQRGCHTGCKKQINNKSSHSTLITSLHLRGRNRKQGNYPPAPLPRFETVALSAEYDMGINRAQNKAKEYKSYDDWHTASMILKVSWAFLQLVKFHYPAVRTFHIAIPQPTPPWPRSSSPRNPLGIYPPAE